MPDSAIVDHRSESISCIRQRCQGFPPLDARIEDWMVRWLNRTTSNGTTLHQAVQQFGSPLNIISVEPLHRNIERFREVARARNLDFQIYFARKSNKCLSFVEQTLASQIGVDTASENEIRQCLTCGVDPKNLVCTAAIKDASLINLCIAQNVCIVVDNDDELEAISERARAVGQAANIAVRLGGFQHAGGKLHTRFGFDVDRDIDSISTLSQLPVNVMGVHFHLDGYDSDQRVSAINASLQWVKILQDQGHRPSFLDMGGGIPMSYLDDAQQWHQFWQVHEEALLEKRPPITYRNHALGRQVVGQKVIGSPNTYPYFQEPTQASWFAKVLDAKSNGESIADRIRNLGLQLRCEPGRSLLDGCGMTVACVEFRKRNADGDFLIGLSMNRTQCRTSSDDFLVDPILVPRKVQSSDPMEGYLVGSYCTESELITLRKLRFHQGVQRGDLLVFPNTAGYLMHFLESRSHQFPLAKNLCVRGETTVELDSIDDC